MGPEVTSVNQPCPVLSGFDRLSLAKTWLLGDRSTPEPTLYAHEIRALLLEYTGKGRAAETLIAMGQAGELPAYEDRSRRTRTGGHPTVFRWSEVMPILVGRGRNQGSNPTKIVPITPAPRAPRRRS